MITRIISAIGHQLYDIVHIYDVILLDINFTKDVNSLMGGFHR